jgi:hypothetical protein
MATCKGLIRISVLGLAFLSGLDLLILPGRARAQDAGVVTPPDELRNKALKKPGPDWLSILRFAQDTANGLKGEGKSRSEASRVLTESLTDFIGQIEDIDPNAQGRVILNQDLDRIRDIAVEAVLNRAYGKVDAVPATATGATPAELKPSDRLKKQNLNIQLYALQEFKDLQKDTKLTASQVRDQLVQKVLEFATQVADLDDATANPKGATEAEKKYLTSLCDEVIAGRVERPKVGPQIGISDEDRDRFHDTLLIRGAELARKVKPDSEDYRKQLRPIAEQEFRKLAKLSDTASMTSAQDRFINSLVRQVASTVGVNIPGVIETVQTPRPGKTTGALDSALRNLILGLAKNLNRALINAAMTNPAAQGFLNSETRRSTLVNFILGMIVKKRGLGGLNELSEAERNEANAIAQEALADAPVNGGGTNPNGTIPVVTTPGFTQPAGPVLFVYPAKPCWFCRP